MQSSGQYGTIKKTDDPLLAMCDNYFPSIDDDTEVKINVYMWP